MSRGSLGHMRYVALLRAINTPPRHVKMDRLRAVLEGLGFDNVETFIASGNVIFDTDDTDLAARIEQALSAELGFDVPTLVLTADEAIATVDEQPFTGAAHVEISFLFTLPTPEAVEELEAAATGADRLAVVGRRLYWSRSGPREESDHSEARVVRILGTQTTRRSLSTIEGIVDKFLR